MICVEPLMVSEVDGVTRCVAENGQEVFFIRMGNATNQLKPSELAPYCAVRWPEGSAGAEQSTEVDR